MSAARREWAATALCTLLGGVALATAPLSAEMLRESCEAYAESPASHPARICASYIQGYLDSARSGAQLVSESATSESSPETWEQRAARTRLGKRYLEALRERERRYCVADSVGVPQIVEQLVEYFRTTPPKPETLAAEALSHTLRQHYPCK